MNYTVNVPKGEKLLYDEKNKKYLLKKLSKKAYEESTGNKYQLFGTVLNILFTIKKKAPNKVFSIQELKDIIYHVMMAYEDMGYKMPPPAHPERILAELMDREFIIEEV